VHFVGLYYIIIHGAKNIKFIAAEASIYFKFPSFEGMQHLHLHGQAAQGLKMKAL
jgi:hypothetical protein